MPTYTPFVKKAEHILLTSQYEGRAFLCYFDFSNFKLVNRNYGRTGGNTLLAAAEDRLGQIPQVAVFERLVSDQFVFLIIADEPRSNEAIIKNYMAFAEEFLCQWRSKYPACHLNTYCGICPVQNGNVLEAIDNASIAWRKAKEKKLTNAMVFDDSMMAPLETYQKAVRETNAALHEDRFIFYLQPKVDLLSGEIIGAEALARCLETDGTIILPDMFLPIMEENGSVIELDRMILRKVCAYMRERLNEGLPVVQISANLSRLHCMAADSAQLIHSIVQEYEIPPHLLEFELTETIMLDQFQEAQDFCNQLRAFGYSVSIDDFGAGYAGVNILQELDFDVLKLDRRFLAEREPLRSRNRVILPDILHTLQGLQIVPLCEGTETANQCRYLVEIGCRCTQGYYFSKPVPPEEFYRKYIALKGKYQLSSAN